MTSEHWDRIDRVWHALLGYPKSDRAAALAELCSGDPELRREIESMLVNLARADEAGFGNADNAAVPLQEGTRLGRYEILAALGAGGMGEVYRARDSRLGRDVAIKVLPAALAGDPDRLDRFEREARAAAALNHPNILAVHDFGTERLQVTPDTAETGVSFMVTELLEGRTLRQLLREEKLSTLRVIDLASQIAEGLAAAHSRGIVHRDLKPENLFVTTDAHLKILDFGLAKASGADASASSLAALATTQSGTASQGILGTPGYMAPEQVRGEQVDHRSDIFVFGAVLYEMVTGQRAFKGETVIDTISAILRDAPAASLSTSSISAVPQGLVRIVERCLEKLPGDRFQSTADLAFALKALIPHDLTAPRAGRNRASQPSASWLSVRLALGLVAAVAVVLVIAWHPWRKSESAVSTSLLTSVNNATNPTSSSPPVAPGQLAPPASPPTAGNENLPMFRPEVNVPAGVTVNPKTASYGPAISPNGERLVFVASKDGGPLQLWLYQFESKNARALEGTESLTRKNPAVDRGPELPFWSPDSKRLAFASSGMLKQIDVDTGVVKTICKIPKDHFQGGTWGPGDTIVFADTPGGLRRVQTEGGTSEALTTVDAQRSEVHKHPAFLPDGHFVFQKMPGRNIAIGSLDPSEKIRVLEEWTDSHIAYGSGYLLYVQSDRLLARAFDLKTLSFKGPSRPIADDVLTHESTGRSTFTVSPKGVLVFRSGAQEGLGRLAWFRRSDGRIDPIPNVNPGFYMGFGLVADDSRVLTQVHSPDGENKLWLFNLETGEGHAVTEDPTTSVTLSRENPEEFMWFEPGSNTVYVKRWKSDQPQKAFPKPAQYTITSVTDWSRRWLLETMLDDMGNRDIWYVPIDDPQHPKRYEENPSIVEHDAVLSPDERWIAYLAQDSKKGLSQIVVRSFPSTEGRWPIPNSERAANLTFSADGRELFFNQTEGRGITAIEIKADGQFFDHEPPKNYAIPAANLQHGFAVSRDGKRFLVSLKGSGEGTDAKRRQFNVVTNWTGLLSRR
jgi:serine/threonine protein kinase